MSVQTSEGDKSPKGGPGCGQQGGRRYHLSCSGGRARQVCSSPSVDGEDTLEVGLDGLTHESATPSHACAPSLAPAGIRSNIYSTAQPFDMITDMPSVHSGSACEQGTSTMCQE